METEADVAVNPDATETETGTKMERHAEGGYIVAVEVPGASNMDVAADGSGEMLAVKIDIEGIRTVLCVLVISIPTLHSCANVETRVNLTVQWNSKLCTERKITIVYL